MPKKNIGPRISDGSGEYLEKYFQSLNFGAQFVLEAWPVLHLFALKEMRGVFSPGELKLIIDVHNGFMPTAQITGQGILAQVMDGCELDRLGAKWDVDQKEIAKKIAYLKTFQRHALEIWAYAFWYGGNGDSTKDLEEYIKALL